MWAAHEDPSLLRTGRGAARMSSWAARPAGSAARDDTARDRARRAPRAITSGVCAAAVASSSDILLGLLAVILIALVGGYLYAKPLLLTGTGYARTTPAPSRASPDGAIRTPTCPRTRSSRTCGPPTPRQQLGDDHGPRCAGRADGILHRRLRLHPREAAHGHTAAPPGTNDEWRRTQAAQKNPTWLRLPTMSAEVTAASPAPSATTSRPRSSRHSAPEGSSSSSTVTSSPSAMPPGSPRRLPSSAGR